MSWNYLVPDLADSPWWDYQMHRVNLNEPHINIFCDRGHRNDPWLIGCFRVSSAVVQQRNEILWTWEREYVTGDGNMIQLGRHTEAEGTQRLIGDSPATSEAITESQLAGESEQVRLRVGDMRCNECGYNRRFRSESVQDILSMFWNIGYREVRLEMLAQRVDNRRT